MSGGSNQITGDQLRSYIDRVRRLQEEITNLNADKREVFSEARANGFDTKVMKALIRRLDADQQELWEFDELLSVYENAYKNGRPDDTPKSGTKPATRARAREPAQAEVRSTEPQWPPEDGPRGERSGRDGTDVPAAKPSASSPDPEPASASLGADTAPAAVEPVAPAAGDLSDTDSAPDAARPSERASAGGGSPPPPPATPSLAPTFTAGDRYAREGWQAYQKGRGRDDHGYLSPERVEGFQRGWDLAERQAQRGQG